MHAASNVHGEPAPGLLLANSQDRELTRAPAETGFNAWADHDKLTIQMTPEPRNCSRGLHAADCGLVFGNTRSAVPRMKLRYPCSDIQPIEISGPSAFGSGPDAICWPQSRTLSPAFRHHLSRLGTSAIQNFSRAVTGAPSSALYRRMGAVLSSNNLLVAG